MAAVVNQATNTGGTASAIGSLTSCTSGNYIGVYFTQTVALTSPTISDNISGGTGWTREALTATVSTGDMWYFHKDVAAGGETTFTITPGTGATGQGVSAVEVSGLGASPTINASAAVNDSGSTVATKATGAITTSDSGCIILACIGMNGTSGVNSNPAWNNSMSNVTVTPAGATRSLLGTRIPASTLSSQTYTATWPNNNRVGSLVFAIAPTAAAGTTVNQLSALGVG